MIFSRRPRRSFWFSKQLLFSLLLVLLLAILAIPVTRSFKSQSAVDKEIAALKAEVAKAETQNSQFKKMISYLESEQFAEEQAKLNLGLKREGEKVAVITGLDEVTAASEAAAAAAAVEAQVDIWSLQRNWQRWLEYFFPQPESQ